MSFKGLGKKSGAIDDLREPVDELLDDVANVENSKCEMELFLDG